MPTALVTGPLEPAADMALALKAAGFEVLAAEPEVAQAPLDLEPVDCYVQLPVDPAPTGEEALSRAHAVVAQTLLARFDAAALVAPMLATNARVVLVADPAEAIPAGDMRLVRILIEAIIADHGTDNVRVAVIDGARTPDEIAGIVRLQRRSWANPALDPHLGFSDWRNEIVSLRSLDPWT